MTDEGPDANSAKVIGQFTGLLSRYRPLTVCAERITGDDPLYLTFLESLAVGEGLGPICVVIVDNGDSSSEVLRKRLKNFCISVSTLPVEALDEEYAVAFVADVLGQGINESRALAKVLFQRVGGNPFILYSTLKRLHSEGKLQRSKSGNRFFLSAEESLQMSPSAWGTNLSADCRTLLQYASSLVPPFSPRTLTICTRLPDLGDLLEEALDNGILQQIKGETELYKFVHPLLQEYWYSSVPLEERERRHLSIARALSSADAPFDTPASSVAYHYNRAGKIERREEREAVAALDVRLAEEAGAVGADRRAAEYLEDAIAILGEDGWVDQYDYLFELYLRLIHYQSSSGELDDAGNSLDDVELRVQTKLHAAHIKKLRCQLLSQYYRFGESVARGLEGLEELGITVGDGEYSVILSQVIERVRSRLKGIEACELLKLPEVTDAPGLLMQELFSSLFVPSYNTAGDLNALLTWHALEHIIVNGNSRFSPCCYMALAIHYMQHGDVELARQYSDIAFELSKRYPNAPLAQLYHMFGCWLSPWLENLPSSVSWLERAYYQGVQSGDVVFAGCAIMIKAIYEVELVSNAGKTLEEWRVHETFLRKTEQNRALATLLVSRQFLRALQGQTKGYSELDDDEFSESDFLRDARENGWNVAEAWYYLVKARLLTLLGKPREASEFLHTGAGLIRAIAAGSLLEVDLDFQLALTHMLQGMEPTNGDSIIDKLNTHSDGTGRRRALLLEAERLKQSGDDLAALRAYNHAIREPGIATPLLSAFISEQLGNLYSKHELDDAAALSLSRSLKCYRDLGVTTKVTILGRKGGERFHSLETLTETAVEGGKSSADVDFAAIISASQAVSQELNLSSLFDRVLSIIVTNAGATRGVLLLRDQRGTLKAEREVRVEGDALRISSPVGGVLLCESVVTYVTRSRRDIIIDDAGSSEITRRDKYLSQASLRSVLCKMISVGGEAEGLIYLENSLTTAAFTEERLAILDALTPQIVISFRNAQLMSALSDKERHLRTILSDMVEGVVAFNKDGEVVLLNKAARSILGERENDSLDEGIPDLTQLRLKYPDGSRVPSKELPHLRALAGESLAALELVLHKDDSGVTLQVSAAPLHSSSGEVSGAVVVVRDISELKVLDELKANFLRVVAHELKTPVAVVKGYAQLLQRKSMQERSSELLPSLIEGCDHLSRLVNDLLDISLIKAGRFSFVPVELDVDHVMEECVGALQRCSVAPNPLTYVGPGRSCLVLADPDRLKQVINNLLSNACKYSSPDAKVSVTVQVAEQEVIVAIADEGIGIPKEKQSKIFDSFYRAHAETMHDYDGMGIGLYIAKQIIVSQGGRIWFASEEGRGSTFYFSLPLMN